MVKEKDTDFLKFPGGGVEEGEDLEAALKRELQEELAGEAKEYQLYLETDLRGRKEGTMIHFVVFKGELEEGWGKGTDVEEICWVDSNFEAAGQNIGHLAKMAVLPKLKQDGLIG